MAININLLKNTRVFRRKWTIRHDLPFKNFLRTLATILKLYDWSVSFKEADRVFDICFKEELDVSSNKSIETNKNGK